MKSLPSTRATGLCRCVLSTVFCAALTAVSVSAKDDNDGILNGPLASPGHRATHMGTKKTLSMAIMDMMASYGDAYPKGQEYLERLSKIKDEKDPAFEVLKREAMLANPALAFDKVLLVRSQKGSRFSANWQNRASMREQGGRTMSNKDLGNLAKDLCRRDRTMKGLSKNESDAKKAVSNRAKEITRSQAYKQEKDGKKRKAMIASDAKHQTLSKKAAQLKSKLDTAIKNHPRHKRMVEQIKSKEKIFNYENDLVVLSLKDGCKVTPVFKPTEPRFIGDVDLHWNGDRILFSSHRDIKSLTPKPGRGRGWAVFELAIDPKTGKAAGSPRPISPDLGSDVDCFDPVYLPDGHVIFSSTASYQGVPCVGGKDYVSNLYRINGDGTGIRRITFDQETNWHPCVMENGRVLFTRWEYTDSAHYYSRVLMSMNPDGTDQKAYYGSNSYWPNSIFYARQIPGKQSMFVATVTGHHDAAKNGPLVLFDVAKGRNEADGAVQILTGRGKKVAPIVHDRLTRNYSPIFNHPYPLNEKYYLAGNSGGEVFLIDVFDNVLKLNDTKDGKLYEPVPLRKSAVPKIIPDRTRLEKKDATVLINDVHFGPGLEGVPRGTVKSLRVYRYEFSPRNSGSHYAMGMEAGWDAKQVLGTVPVEKDGSASFKVPANTPFAMQPLDENGRALQLMRSWTVAMPGESLSCIGCHEDQNSTPPNKRYEAMLRAPSEPKPFYGPTRGFSFKREVQPVLDKFCIGCHDGNKDWGNDGRDKKGRFIVADRIIGTGKDTGKRFREHGIPDFTKGDRATFTVLHPYLRRNGPEGDYHLLTPSEFHVNTSELFQMLEKGHHGVALDKEAWDKLSTWADLNAPLHGTWSESAPKSKGVLVRRQELRETITGSEYNAESLPTKIPAVKESASPIIPKPVVPVRSPAPAASLVNKDKGTAIELDLGSKITMKLVGIPSGEFSMGSQSETPVEQPVSQVKIPQAFHMGATEVTLRQYRQFDPDYLNGVYDMHYKDQVKRGYYMNDMDYPVIRVSWDRAMAFCEWLSKKTGKTVTLPTEAEWEWACRAGTTTPLSFGDVNATFSKHANLADVTVKQMAVKGVNPKPIKNPPPSMDFELKDPRSNDGALHLSEVGKYVANPWGLHDMHGNAAEWTLSKYERYPYKQDDGRNAAGKGDRVVRGGSWHDRPFRSTSSYRLGFPSWQRVYHTGFRIVVK